MLIIRANLTALFSCCKTLLKLLLWAEIPTRLWAQGRSHENLILCEMYRLTVGKQVSYSMSLSGFNPFFTFKSKV